MMTMTRMRRRRKTTRRRGTDEEDADGFDMPRSTPAAARYGAVTLKTGVSVLYHNYMEKNPPPDCFFAPWGAAP